MQKFRSYKQMVEEGNFFTDVLGIASTAFMKDSQKSKRIKDEIFRNREARIAAQKAKKEPAAVQPKPQPVKKKEKPVSIKKPNAFMAWHTATVKTNPTFGATPKPADQPQPTKKPNAFMAWHTATVKTNPTFGATPKPADQPQPTKKKEKIDFGKIEYGVGEPGKGHPGEKTIYKKAATSSPVKQEPLAKPNIKPFKRDTRFDELDDILQQFTPSDHPLAKKKPAQSSGADTTKRSLRNVLRKPSASNTRTSNMMSFREHLENTTYLNALNEEYITEMFGGLPAWLTNNPPTRLFKSSMKHLSDVAKFFGREIFDVEDPLSKATEVVVKATKGQTYREFLTRLVRNPASVGKQVLDIAKLVATACLRMINPALLAKYTAAVYNAKSPEELLSVLRDIARNYRPFIIVLMIMPVPAPAVLAGLTAVVYAAKAPFNWKEYSKYAWTYFKDVIVPRLKETWIHVTAGAM